MMISEAYNQGMPGKTLHSDGQVCCPLHCRR
jgi:hypothetical protein